MSKNELVSVIVTTFNYGHYICEAIESILNQDYHPLEIIVIDDGSTDNTKEIINKYSDRLKYVYQSNQGVAVALNRGVEIAAGKYIGFIDADDIWETNKTSIQMKSFDAKEHIDVVFGNVKQFYSPELTETERSRFLCPEGKLPGFSKGTMLVKTKIFSDSRGFNEENNFSDFVEWFGRRREDGVDYFMLDDLVLNRRIHLNNMTTKYKNKNQQETLRLLRKRLNRKKSI